MIVVKVKGGFGNQLFQYALGLYLQTNFNVEIKYDISFFSIKHKLNTPRDLALDILIKDFKNKVCIGRGTNKINFPFFLNKTNAGDYLDHLNLIVNKRLNKYYYIQQNDLIDLDSLTKYKFLDGYWQNKYLVLQIRDKLVDSFDKGVMESLYNSFVKLYDITANDVCVHIRRGDYAHQAAANATHGLCSIDYYKQGMGYFENMIDQPRFFFFSDDIKWAMDNFGGASNTVFVDLDTPLKDMSEFFMMTKFKHFIIANSTYSWWAAILSKSLSVVAPQKWFVNGDNELAHEEWKLL